MATSNMEGYWQLKINQGHNQGLCGLPLVNVKPSKPRGLAEANGEALLCFGVSLSPGQKTLKSLIKKGKSFSFEIWKLQDPDCAGLSVWRVYGRPATVANTVPIRSQQFLLEIGGAAVRQRKEGFRGK